MKIESGILISRLQALTSGAEPLRWLVAFSGGMDSTVLLHALSACRAQMSQKVIALHVNHGMHADSSQWDAHCRRIAGEFDVEYESLNVAVAEDAGSGLEAAAREARYAALGSKTKAGDCLLSAHHEDDQAETLLLNLLRGSGLAGIAGIGAKREFSAGMLLRPLLGFSAADIAAYARQHDLAWIEDPSNTDTRFDRNFLRRKVLPVLASRWPAVSARFRQSAELAGEASLLLNELADIDLQCHESPARLSVSELVSLTLPRQRNVLRRAVQICGLPSPPASRLYQAVHELLPAREDAQPLVSWNGAELRRYRDKLFVLQELPVAEQNMNECLLPNGKMLELGRGMGALQLMPSTTNGIDPELARNGLQLRYRIGGEEIRLQGHELTHKLKKLLQQDGVLPWMRDRLPLLYAEDRLVAVADLWVADDCLAQEGHDVHWHNRPALR
ncbi:MAG: tRNA(Ile)-lysidine synthase [Woeseiaceae bacterium]|jgi:tRNA(Ile)-lysidine synthase